MKLWLRGDYCNVCQLYLDFKKENYKGFEIFILIADQLVSLLQFDVCCQKSKESLLGLLAKIKCSTCFISLVFIALAGVAQWLSASLRIKGTLVQCSVEGTRSLVGGA